MRVTATDWTPSPEGRTQEGYAGLGGRRVPGGTEPAAQTFVSSQPEVKGEIDKGPIELAPNAPPSLPAPPLSLSSALAGDLSEVMDWH